MFTPHPANTALVITDPQNDFLSPGGKGYHLTKNNIEQNNTLANLEILMHTAMSKGYQLFISPHYIYPHDYSWQFTGAEQDMRDLIENGFETAVVYDATATISEQAFQAAVTNYQAFSSATWSTEQAISHM